MRPRGVLSSPRSLRYRPRVLPRLLAAMRLRPPLLRHPIRGDFPYLPVTLPIRGRRHVPAGPPAGPWAAPVLAPPADPWAAPVPAAPPADSWAAPVPAGPPGAPWAGPSPLPPPPPAPAWLPPPAFPLAPDAYPVNISYERRATFNRLWGIPILGVLIRSILVIPHILVLSLVAIVVTIQLLLTWIPVLLLGRFPGWGYRWVGGYLGWAARVGAYVSLLTPTYPPFSLSGDDHPIRVRYDEGVRIFRLWGLPVVGTLFRAVLLIPHFIALWFVGLLAAVLVIFSWVPVLFMGRQADVIYSVVGGATRWWLRVAAYLFKMVDRYPPFSLGEDDPALY